MSVKKVIKYLLIFLVLGGLSSLLGMRIYQVVKSKQQQAAGGPGAGGPGAGGGAGGPGGARGGPGGGPGGGGGRMQMVQTDVITSGRVSEKVQLTGSLKPREQVDVSPKIGGRLVRVLPDTGYPIARGALVAEIEDDEIRQQIERSKAAIAVVDATIAQRDAELANAKVELDRKRQLVEAGLMSRLELDMLETRVRVSQSQLELARAQRRQSEAEQRELNIRQAQTRVYAPMSGVIAKRTLDAGAMVGTNTPIVTIVSLSPMVVEARAPEADIARIRRGMPVSITVDSLPGQKITGRVTRISPLLDPQTRNGLVEIEIPNKGGALKSEMFARVELDLGSARDTLLLPRDALVYRGEQPGVYIIESEKAKFVTLETGLTQGDKVEVVSGLKAGDTVITKGSNLLKDGDRVRIMGKGGPGAGPGQGGGPGQGQAGAAPQAAGPKGPGEAQGGAGQPGAVAEGQGGPRGQNGPGAAPQGQPAADTVRKGVQ